MLSDKVSERRRASVWPLALLLLFLGIALTPIGPRRAIIMKLFDPGSLGWVNYPAVVAAVLMIVWGFIHRKEYDRFDIFLMYLGLVLLIPITVSDGDVYFRKYCAALLNVALPFFVIFQTMDRDRRRIWLGRNVKVLYVLSFILLIFGVIEMISGGALVRIVNSLFNAHGMKIGQYDSFIEALDGGKRRFYSFWGGAMFNSLIFMGIFIINDIYYRSIGRTYRKMLLAIVTAAGIVLCLDQAAMILFGIYLLLSCFAQMKEGKEAEENGLSLIVCLAVGGLLIIGGGLMQIFGILDYPPVSRDMLNELRDYRANSVDSLLLYKGYGTATIYNSNFADYGDAFGLAALMMSLDYGIVFALVFTLAYFAFFTWKVLIRKKRFVCWAGITAFFIQVNLFSGFGMINYDVSWITSVFIMLAVNAVYARYDQEAFNG